MTYIIDRLQKRYGDKRYLRGFPLVLLFIAATWQIWPALKAPVISLFGLGDDALIVWIINQTIQKIPHDLGNIFNADIFYPYNNTLAYSVLFVPSAILSYIPVKLTGSHVMAYNFTLIVAQYSTLFVLYFWLKDISQDSWASFVGTLAFGLSRLRMSFFVHAHMFIMQWLLASAWMLWKYNKEKKPWQLYIAGIFFTIQIWESFYQAYWILVFGAILLLPKLRTLRIHAKHILVISISVIILTLPLLGAYYSVYQEFGMVSSIREHANQSMSIDDLWTKYLSVGFFGVVVLSLLVLRKVKVKKKKEFKWLLFILLFGFVMALGPVLKWDGKTVKVFGEQFIPLPYGVLYYILPGLKALRSVHRWIWISGFAASGIIAVSIAQHKKQFKIFIVILFLCLSIVGGVRAREPEYFPKPKDYPNVYQWLKEQPGEVILELPIYAWTDREHRREMFRMLYSLNHGKSLINGASGFMSEDREILLGRIQREYPNDLLHEYLRKIGVDYIILHSNEIEQATKNSFKLHHLSKEVWNDENTTVYLLD